MLRESIDTAYLHFNRAKDNYDEIIQQPVDLDIYNDRERIKTIDAFIYRFIKLQDFMGDKLFKAVLERLGEYKDTMSLLDVLDKMEKLGIIADADRWIEFRIARNKLTHEYPDNKEDVVEGIRLAIVYFKEISDILHSIRQYIQQRELA